MFFGMLPPEVNSGLMYTGPGSGPMLAAASAWEALAGELVSGARSCQAVITALTDGSWRGPTATLMAGAVGPYTGWLAATGTQAGQAAAQARAAAGAYETAFAATVPPWVVATNRSLLMTLIATNVLGQNTAAIAATEAHYAEMWAQDAAAMHGYSASAASAMQLTPFTEPPRGGNPAGSPAASALQGVSPAQAVPELVIGELTPGILLGLSGVPWLFAMQNITLPIASQTLLANQRKAAALGLLGAPPGAVAELPPNALTAAGAGRVGALPAVSAGLGRADAVNGLSVPRNWADFAPGVRTLVALPATAPAAAAASATAGMGTQDSTFGAATAGTLTGRALGATGAAASRTIAKVNATVSAAGSGDPKLPTTTIVVIPEDDEDPDDGPGYGRTSGRR